jgi:hypothetical protein
MTAGPIKDALQALSRHADVVEQAVMGGSIGQESLPKGAVQALRQASALRAAGEEHWRLHPRLREYLQDHLQMFPQFQSLTDISSKLALLQHLLTDAQTAVAERDYESLEFQLASMETAVYDIADATDRNLTFLAGMVSTKYGNVRTFAAKMVLAAIGHPGRRPEPAWSNFQPCGEGSRRAWVARFSPDSSCAPIPCAGLAARPVGHTDSDSPGNLPDSSNRS